MKPNENKCIKTAQAIFYRHSLLLMLLLYSVLSAMSCIILDAVLQ